MRGGAWAKKSTTNPEKDHPRIHATETFQKTVFFQKHSKLRALAAVCRSSCAPVRAGGCGPQLVGDVHGKKVCCLLLFLHFSKEGRPPQKKEAGRQLQDQWAAQSSSTRVSKGWKEGPEGAGPLSEFPLLNKSQKNETP
jgi:hypothetical protein